MNKKKELKIYLGGFEDEYPELLAQGLIRKEEITVSLRGDSIWDPTLRDTVYSPTKKKIIREYVKVADLEKVWGKLIVKLPPRKKFSNIEDREWLAEVLSVATECLGGKYFYGYVFGNFSFQRLLEVAEEYVTREYPWVTDFRKRLVKMLNNHPT